MTPRSGSKVSHSRCYPPGSDRKSEDEEKPEHVARKAAWYGLDSLSDEELLWLLLDPEELAGSGKKQARKVLDQLGGFGPLRSLRPHAIASRCSIDLKQATRIGCAIELGQRASRDNLLSPPTHPLTFDQVVRWARPRLAGLDHEEVWVLCVNSHSALRSAWQVGRGGMHGCGLLARDLLLPVVRDGASGFILVHNHPSGDPTPSSEDIDLTRGIQLAGMSLCIPLLDHVVVARSGATSFFELGYLDR